MDTATVAASAVDIMLAVGPVDSAGYPQMHYSDGTVSLELQA